jgi:thiaminase
LRALADGTLPDELLAEWAQQTRFLCQAELRALGALGSYSLPVGMDGLLAHLGADTRQGIVWLEDLLGELGQDLAGEDEAWPLCVGYSAYLLECCRGGLIDGIAATHASELTYLRTCEWVYPGLPEGSRLRPWFNSWSDDGFRGDVAGLGGYLDALVGVPSAAMRDHLTRMIRTVACFELAWWQMCSDRQEWPAVPGRAGADG